MSEQAKPSEMKIAGQAIGDGIGWACEVVVAGDVSMVTLMDAKEA